MKGKTMTTRQELEHYFAALAELKARKEAGVIHGVDSRELRDKLKKRSSDADIALHSALEMIYDVGAARLKAVPAEIRFGWIAELRDANVVRLALSIADAIDAMEMPEPEPTKEDLVALYYTSGSMCRKTFVETPSEARNQLRQQAAMNAKPAPLLLDYSGDGGLGYVGSGGRGSTQLGQVRRITIRH